jgi:hypothetical protein
MFLDSDDFYVVDVASVVKLFEESVCRRATGATL